MDGIQAKEKGLLRRPGESVAGWQMDLAEGPVRREGPRFA